MLPYFRMDVGRRAAFLSVARRFGTPVYVYDAGRIQVQAEALKQHLPFASFFYAMKANSNPAILRLVRQLGLGVETMSRGEIRLARSLGFSKERISFTASSISEDELRFAARYAGRVHLDSLHQLELWGRLRLGEEISLRLNQGFGAGRHQHVITGGPGSKFGITLADLPRARQLAARYKLRVVSLQQHIGSNILDAGIILRAARSLFAAARDFPEVHFLDFGGGFGVPYKPEEQPLDLVRFGEGFAVLRDRFARREGREVACAFEPGRFLVAQAGTLLVRVTDIKQTERHLFVGVDSGFNHLIRPAMYGSYHHIDNLSRTRGPRVRATVVGNICESGDIFAKDRELVRPRIGDVLAVRDAGAYGFAMASFYNMRPLPREILMTPNGTVQDISFSPARFLMKTKGR